VVRARLIIGGVGAVLALACLAWVLREPIVQAYWRFQARRPLTAEEQSALAGCTDPGWTGLMRVTEQDLDVPCPELWLAEVAATHLEPPQMAWTKGLLEEPERSPRAKLRAASFLLEAGQPPEPDMAYLVADPAISEEVRTEYVDALLEGRISGTWADPSLLRRVDLARFEAGELTAYRSVQRTLRLSSLHPEVLEEAERRARVEEVLGMAGLGGDRLERALERHQSGRSWQGVPPHLEGIVADRGGDCRDRTSGDCLRLAADLLDLVAERARQGVDGGPELAELPPPPPRVTLPRSLWLVLYDGAPALVAAAEEELGALAAWVGAAPESERPGRLLGSIADPRAPYGVSEVRAGALGDPLYALSLRRSAPWTSALAAVAVGRVAGVEVTVHSFGDGVILRAGDRRAVVGRCGEVVPPPEAPGPAWPAPAVLAQAAVEAAGGALRAGDVALARRLAALAQRLDPIGAGGVAEAVASVAGSPSSEGARLGMVAGAMVASLPAGVLTGAEAERGTRPTAWSDLSESWTIPPEPGSCPSVLGP